MKNNYLPVIGLEIHIELKTKSKMFCSCSTNHFGKPPNTLCCPTCLGLPGALPVANKKAIEWTVMAGLALGCQIPLFSKFDRKNYFYPDLPKGYQISQYDLPFAVNGKLKYEVGSTKYEVGIRRVHLEEDTAKMIHSKDATLIDFNRSGTPLMEIVTEPDIGSPLEAKEFLKKLQQIIRYLNISDCDMEKGTMRCEPNISVGKATNNKQQTTKLPDYKVEIKNLNSFRFVEKAIDFEICRQVQLIKAGKKPIQETRGWDEIKQITFTQRVKEESTDYRYFPEPDLPPIHWKSLDIVKIKKLIPELPDPKISRFVSQFNLTNYQAIILTATRESAEYFESAALRGKKQKLSAQEIANVIINKRLEVSKLLPTELVKILVEKKGRSKTSENDLQNIVKMVIKNNPGPVKDYKNGKISSIEFLLGMVMRETKGTADPKEAREALLEQLS